MGRVKLILFDWGDTVMRDFRQFDGPMHLWPDVAATPGIGDALSAIHDGRKIALATNAIDSSEEEIWLALKRVLLEKHFDKVYCCRKVGSLKPARTFYGHILKEMMMNPRDTVMVGDDFEKDIRGANQSGIFAIWLNRDSNKKPPSRMYEAIQSISDLPNAIARREESLEKDGRTGT